MGVELILYRRGSGRCCGNYRFQVTRSCSRYVSNDCSRVAATDSRLSDQEAQSEPQHPSHRRSLLDDISRFRFAGPVAEEASSRSLCSTIIASAVTLSKLIAFISFLCCTCNVATMHRHEEGVDRDEDRARWIDCREGLQYPHESRSDCRFRNLEFFFFCESDTGVVVRLDCITSQRVL